MVANLLFSVSFFSVIIYGKPSPTKYSDIMMFDSSEDGIGNNLITLTKNTIQFRRATCKDDGHYQDWQRSFQRFKCQPIDTVVKLGKPADTHTIIPTAVIVKRCGDCGCIGKNQKCLPKTTRMVKYAIKSSTYLKTECAWMDVEEHVECKCGCELTQEDCSSLQVFNNKDCSCSCKNLDEKEHCDRLESKIWNEKNCSCQCRETKICSTGTDWNPSTCSCVRRRRHHR